MLQDGADEEEELPQQVQHWQPTKHGAVPTYSWNESCSTVSYHASEEPG